MKTIKILAFAGSTRSQSFNKTLVRAAADMAKQAGAEVTVVNLADYPMPLYDGDLEQESGIPEKALELKELMDSHQGILLACPEYNGSITAVLKNTLDWLSRQKGAFDGKTAALLSASPGALGGLRGLVHVRSILTNLGVLVIPKQAAVGGASKEFNEDGSFVNERVAQRVKGVVDSLQSLLESLS